MRNSYVRLMLITILILLGLLVSSVSSVRADMLAQQPTVAIATVTGTPEGPTARVNADQEQINVRSGPGTHYGEIGVLVSGQVVPAYGKSALGEWIQIQYAGVSEGIGWVYSPLVTLNRGGELPIVAPPPTSTS